MHGLDVLMPHYNDPDGLDLSLRSIARQTWTGGIRVVIVDDGSSAEHRLAAEAVIERYRARHSDGQPFTIELLLNETNKGRPFTRNALLDAIDSPFVSWLDSGDEWYPRKIEAQMVALHDACTGRDADLVWATCSYDWAWIGGGTRKTLHQRTQLDQQKALLMGSKLRAYLWTLLGSAQSFKSVGYFDERLPRMQDLDFFLRFASQGGELITPETDVALCVYHKSDIGRNADEIRACNQIIFEKHNHLYQLYGTQFCRMRLFNMEMLAARFAQNNHEYKKARSYLWNAFRHRPIAFLKHFRRKGLTA